MAKYIDLDELMEFPIRADHCDKEHANEHFINGIETVLEYARQLPVADVAPVRHSYWESWSFPKWRRGGYYVCHNSRCRRKTAVKSNYCPNCGAKME